LRHLLAHDVAVQLRHDLPGRQLLEPRQRLLRSRGSGQLVFGCPGRLGHQSSRIVMCVLVYTQISAAISSERCTISRAGSFDTVSPVVPWPSPPRATGLSRRTQRIVVEWSCFMSLTRGDAPGDTPSSVAPRMYEYTPASWTARRDPAAPARPASRRRRRAGAWRTSGATSGRAGRGPAPACPAAA